MQTSGSNRSWKKLAVTASAVLLITMVVYLHGYPTTHRQESNAAVAMGHPSASYEAQLGRELVFLATAPTLSRVQYCNPSQKALQPIAPRTFTLPFMWHEACHRVEYPAGAWLGDDRNWCWVWMMQECYWNRDYTWTELQSMVASYGLAPRPGTVPMPGLENPGICDRHDAGAPLTGVSLSEKQAALAWLNATVAIHVLNLDSDVKKWETISKRFWAVGITTFTRIPGIDLSQNGSFKEAQQQGWVPTNWSYAEAWNNTKELFKTSDPKVARQKELMDMGLGTVGCAAAHLRAMQRAKDHADALHKPLVLIFEDDARIEDDFAVKLQRLIEQEAPCDWDAISLMSQCPFGVCVTPHLARIQPDGNEPEYRCYHGGTYGFYGMLYRASSLGFIRNRLWEVIWDASRPSCLPVDVAMASISDEVGYYAVPQTQLPGFLREASLKSHRLQINGKGAKKLGIPLESTMKRKKK